MNKEVAEQILGQVRKIKRDLAVVEIVLEKFCFGSLRKEEVDAIAWNNIAGITGEMQKLIYLLKDFGEEGEVEAEEKV